MDRLDGSVLLPRRRRLFVNTHTRTNRFRYSQSRLDDVDTRQVVPTTFRYLNGTTIQTNQYSVTEHMRHVTPGSNRGLPGVFFFYEVSSLHVEITEERRGWIPFLTSVCAIVGGVVTVMGLLDQYMFARKGDSRNLVR